MCNLTAHAWHRTCDRVAPSAIHYTYLDDRLVIVSSWDDMHRILEATKSLDGALGPQLTLGKCCRGVVQLHGKNLPRLPARCASLSVISCK